MENGKSNSIKQELTKMKTIDKKTIYVVNRMPSNDIALNDMLDPDGTQERPYRNKQEALYSLADDKDPEPHDPRFPENTDFIVINELK